MADRPLLSRFGWTLRDYAKRVWDNSGEDNIFFLAGGIAFNILLAAVPFVLLLATGLAYLLNQSAEASGREVSAMIDRLLPPSADGKPSPVSQLLIDIVKARGSVGLYSAIGFIWFSTRLFGSLRSVLAAIFDIEQDRGIIDGKIFDIKLTVVSTLLVVAYTALSAYLAIASSRGVAVLAKLGVHASVAGGLEYTAGRLLGFLIVTLMFFALYKFLPIRRVRTKTAWVAALFTTVMFELAKVAFNVYVDSFNPGSLYTGAVAAVVVIVVWVYYAALIFILGGEVGQVFELRRTRKRQREVFLD